MRKERLGDLDVRITGGTDGRGGGNGPVVVLLHGFGAPGDDLVPLADMVPLPAPLAASATKSPAGAMSGAMGGALRFAFPAGPVSLSMGGMALFGEARAWWMLDMERIQRVMMGGGRIDLSDEEPEGLVPARERVLAMLDALVQRLDVTPDRMVLGGFSQGAMLSCDIAMHTALHTGRPLAGLVLLSGTLLAAPRWRAGMPALAGLPVFQSHGQGDPILPFDMAERLRDELRQGGLPVDWHPFPGGHDIPRPVLHALGGFLGRVLPAA